MGPTWREAAASRPARFRAATVGVGVPLLLVPAVRRVVTAVNHCYRRPDWPASARHPAAR